MENNTHQNATSVQVFQHPEFGNIRTTLTQEGEPIFCLVDLCRALEVKNNRKVKSQLDEDVTLSYPLLTKGGIQQATFVTESGMYTVILRSDSPKAKPMQKWVTSEVLPTIRKTGGYMVSRSDDTPEEIMARALRIADDTIRRKEEQMRILSEQNELHKQELQAAAPKVQYYNEVVSSDSLITINKIASDFGWSAIRLNQVLCEKKVQYREGNCYLLYSNYRDKGYASIKSMPYFDRNGDIRTRQHLYWTEKGREFIHNLL